MYLHCTYKFGYNLEVIDTSLCVSASFYEGTIFASSWTLRFYNVGVADMFLCDARSHRRGELS